jgi:D-alanyl-lipoteichoic acid acyltransferase DltB (MBOAT superfamily)
MNWNAKYAIFLLSSTIITYFGARLVHAARQGKSRKGWLALSIVLNLSMLLSFKYLDFFAVTLSAVLKHLGAGVNFPEFKWLLPVGISFYTFQSLGYMIDVYRGKIGPEKHFGIYSLFVSFFPQVASGPINRAPDLIPQFLKKHEFDYNRVRTGLLQMLWGYFKKLVVADRLAVIVNTVFDHPADHQGMEIVIAVIFFAIQIYCDFSGYTDIAIGAARIMGFDLMKNFRAPYFSMSVTEFWRRWHISLSTWFRDYVYFPLGGNKKGKIRTYFNLFIVFLVSGLWHGAAMTFVVWGALHGLYIVAEKAYRPLQQKLYQRLNWNMEVFSFKLYRILITAGMVTFAWIFFRANSLSDAFLLIRNVTHWNWNVFFTNKLLDLGLDYKEFHVAVIAIIFLFVMEILQESSDLVMSFFRQHLIFRWAVYILAVMVVLIFGYYGTGEKTFIYFQF